MQIGVHAAVLRIHRVKRGVQKRGLYLPEHLHHMGVALAFQAGIAFVQLVGQQIVVFNGLALDAQRGQQQRCRKTRAVFASGAVKHLRCGLLQQMLHEPAISARVAIHKVAVGLAHHRHSVFGGGHHALRGQRLHARHDGRLDGQ